MVRLRAVRFRSGRSRGRRMFFVWSCGHWRAGWRQARPRPVRMLVGIRPVEGHESPRSGRGTSMPKSGASPMPIRALLKGQRVRQLLQRNLSPVTRRCCQRIIRGDLNPTRFFTGIHMVIRSANPGGDKHADDDERQTDDRHGRGQARSAARTWPGRMFSGAACRYEPCRREAERSYSHRAESRLVTQQTLCRCRRGSRT